MAILIRHGNVPVTRTNWQRALEIDYEFKTGMFTSRDGHEQRWALRDTARVRISHAALLQDDELRRLHADIADRQASDLFVVAPRHRWVSLAAPATALDGSVTVDTTPFWIEDDIYLVIEDSTTQEAVKVASVAGPVLTLEAPLNASFATGTKVYLAYSARMRDRVSVTARTATVWEGFFEWDVDPGSDPQAVPAVAQTLFEDVEVFLVQPNWREAPRLEFLAEREIADADRGLINIVTPWAFNPQSEQLLFTGRTADQAEELVGFFLRKLGKRTSFWMPTGQRDIVSASTEIATSTEFTVSGSDFLTAFAGSDTYNVVAARWPDGSTQLNRIVSMVPAGSDTTLNFTDPWDNAISPTTLLSWCPRWRFTADSLTVRWFTDAVAEMQFNVRQIMNEAP